jgi:2Fe-2S ferredoxin
VVQVLFRTLEGSETAVEARVGESLMAAAVRHRVPGIEAACGGSMVCGTCHVYVSEPWLSQLPAVSEMEAEMHEYGVHVEANSRLACQIPVTPALEGAVVTTPPAQR